MAEGQQPRDPAETMPIPESFRRYFTRCMDHIVAEQRPQRDDVAPQVQIQRKANFELADAETKDGVLNAKEYMTFARIEHRHYTESTGADIAFSEDLHRLGFECLQFQGLKDAQGRPGVTYRDLEIADWFSARLFQELMLSQQ